MSILLTSGLSIVIIILIIGWLFFKLPDINWYNVSMYLFLAAFWIVISMTRKSIPDENPTTMASWIWPLVIASYQGAQVLTRIPLGKLSQKIKSRQIPILIATFAISTSALLLVIGDFAFWSLVAAATLTGVFGATYGMQNQYWSENFNIKAVFMSVALIAILPSFGSLVGTFIFESNELFNNDSNRWIILTIAILTTVISIIYYFWPEKKETIRLDNFSEINYAITQLKFKDLLIWAGIMIITTFGFNLVTSGGTSGDVVSSSVDIETVILTIVAVGVALMTTLFLIRIFKSHTLILIAKSLIILGFLLGVIFTFSNINGAYSRISYLIIVTIGFNLFQYTMVGITLHCDHKNHMLFLGIWLTLRSASTASGEIVGGEIKAFFGASALKWLALSALIIAIFSLIYSLVFYRWKNKVIFDVVDHYEYQNKIKIFTK